MPFVYLLWGMHLVLCTLSPLARAFLHPCASCAVCALLSLASQKHHARTTLMQLSLQALYGRLSMLAEAAAQNNVKLLIDAEHTFYQPVREA